MRRISIVLLLFLSIFLSSQEKPKEIKKKVPNDTTTVERKADSIYIRQQATKMKLESLIKETKKR